MLAGATKSGMKAGAHSVQTNSFPMGASEMITVVLVDDQELIRGAVRQALESADFHVVGEARTAESGVETVLDLRPDVVLMDFAFPGGSGIEAIQQISVLAPASRILVLTASRDRACLLEAIVAGACGYILKDAGAEAIVKGVRASAAGECVISPEVAGGLLARIRERDIRLTARGEHSADAIRGALTQRELEIFKRLASGASNQEIGRAFSLSENTIKNHVASILAKLHLDNRIQAAAQAVRTGFSCVAGGFIFQAVSAEWDLPGTLSVVLGG
jgi:DNA-binding NarL/FixJ family response regulator